MLVFIGSDHAGFEYKKQLVDYLKSKQYNVIDLGNSSDESCDYPDYAHPVAESVTHNKESFGVLICGSGNGVCMTANKHNNARAALVWNKEICLLARKHNDANIICLPSRFINTDQMIEFVDLFLNTQFEQDRHTKRVGKINLKL